MSGVSVDHLSQTNPTSSRARSGGRDSAPASNDHFAMFVDNDASAGDKAAARPSSTSAQTDSRNAAATSARQDAGAPDTTQTVAPGPTTTNASRLQDKPASTEAPSIAQDETAIAEAGSEQPATNESAVPIAVFIGLQSGIGVPADTTIESIDAVSVANPPAALPGETAALALARVAQAAAADSAPDQTSAQAPAEVTAADVDQPAQIPLPVPAVVAPDQASANAALETATDLATRIPVQAIEVEADAKLQATIAGPADDATGHGRLIATTIAQPVLAPLKPSAPSDTTTLKPADDQTGAKPVGPDAKAADTPPSSARHAAAQTTGNADNSPAATQPNEKAAAAHSHAASDTSTLADITPNALPTPTQLHAAATASQLTATAATPNVAVPVAALAVEIAANVQIGRSRFEIRLDPPELGRIEVKLDVDRQGQVTSHIIVEKAATLDLLRRDAPQLERALQDAGLKTSDNGLQFSLRDQSSQGRADDNDNRRNAQHLTITEDETVPREAAGRSYGRMLSPSGGIDMRV